MEDSNPMHRKERAFFSLPTTLKARFLLYAFFSLFHRTLNLCLHLFNISRMKISGIQYGRNFKTEGIIIIDIYPESEVVIGNDVSIISDSRRATSAALAFPAKFKTFSKTSRIIIGDSVGLNGTSLTARSRTIHIGAGTIIAPNVIVVDSDFHIPWPPEQRRYYPGDEHDHDVLIGNNCWIGMNSVILKGVHIGENSVIAAGSIVTSDIPENSLAAGVPAKVVKVYKSV